jgi:SAM-dependent methyltransferase
VGGNRITERWNYRRYRRISDDEWCQTLLDSVSGASSVPMPGFPSDEVQRAFVGLAGTDTIMEAWRFYSLMADRRKRYGLGLGSHSYVLDFGCGWGRLARMFLRDVPGSHIYLADTWDRPLDVCRETGVPGRRVRVPQMPPSPLPSDHFDLVFAYSVFSHLSPMAHLAWRTELARCIKPGGLAFITTQPRWFFDECRRYREHPELRSQRWHEKLAKSFVDYDAACASYDRGEFLFVGNDPLPDDPPELGPDFYGEAVVPAEYFEKTWGDAGFELVEFVADPSVCAQAVGVLRRVVPPTVR